MPSEITFVDQNTVPERLRVFMLMRVQITSIIPVEFPNKVYVDLEKGLDRVKVEHLIRNDTHDQVFDDQILYWLRFMDK